MFGDCFFGGPWILFFTKTSKNNGIIIALTTRGKEEGSEGDRQADGGREGGCNECSK